jgi:predicted transcriptional regulator of viral defense system
LCDLVEKGYLARTKRGIYMIPEEKRVPMAAEESLPF